MPGIAGTLKSSWLRLISILFSTLLVSCCLPSADYPLLAFVSLVPLALGLRNVRPIQGLLLGLIFGFSAWLVSTWWTINGLMNMLDWSVKAALAGLFFLCLYQALPYALFGLLCGWVNNKKLKTGPFFCASLLTFLVYLLTEIFPGSLAHALYSWPIAIQTADLGGVHLVHFFLLLCNWLLADILVRLYRQEKILPVCVFLLVLLAGIFIYGQHRINHFHTLAEDASSAEFINITSIQPNIPIKGYEGIALDGPFAGPTGALVKATRQAAEELPDTDLVLWPEVPKSINCACEDFQMQGVAAASVKIEAPILLSCNEFDYGNNPWIDTTGEQLNGTGRHTQKSRKIDKKYNALWLVGQDTCRLAYRKVKLVPFGERTPFQDLFPWLKTYLGRKLEFSPGNGPSLIDLPGGKQIQPLICYEGGFPGLAAQGVASGAQALINVSNDAWFDSAKAAEFHLALSLFRAVEQRRPLVRCTNSGFGAHIAATGEILAQSLTPMNERTARQAKLYCPEQRTPYSWIGDAWLWILAVIVFLIKAAVFQKGFIRQKNPT
ncbi:apolipoprotein N-acyltransferase [Desulfotignum phosphitoxidans]|uniref:Apolipoprotein N-acyltransferase n=1 Tax=Desulfotignum phosphitoxidans DSM 13687 TaxID=1286635 RepID=S0FY92_9BACT|nr:apolipoprotein N-acyltransferase [Desulfotignum phosphitoxidans]EMS78129.1 apolipoprotein N-acyltransferase Lnt [Desulfotignum phosphitoxidans DSM 13687]